VICAPVFVELLAIPGLNVRTVRKALPETAIAIDFDLEENVWTPAAETFAAYAISRRQSGEGSQKRFLRIS
jgi:hypothetical protein